MTIRDAIAATLEGLSRTVRERIARVSIETREEPSPDDLRRGVHLEQIGYFWGSAPSRLPGTALPGAPAAGEIVIFLGAVKPLTFERFRVALWHEIAHALGYTEEEIVNHLGLRL